MMENQHVLEGSLGCVIMASGMGKRFGGNKLLADFRGEPMIARILSATDGLFSSRVVVTRHEDVALFCKQKDVGVVLHDLPLRSDTVRLGLQAIGSVQGCLFCPADQPLLSRETIAALIACAKLEPESIWRPVCCGKEGAPVLFPRWAFGELYSLPDGKGGSYLIKKYPERVRTLPVRDPYELMDADTPQALDELLMRLA